MFGGGGLNPRKMQQMMQQMGIDIAEIDAEEIVIRTPDEELVFDEPEVQRMDAQGQATYTVTGEPETRERGAGGDGVDEEPVALGSGESEAGEGGHEADVGSGGAAIPDGDVEIVAQRTGASEDDAREALIAADGDLADAVSRLE
ncbi:nascent polypeptide-associated complex protein [Halobacteriales archaeon QS_4_69_34]|jgi:nascent polypeptide-associated complex subunit alpha|nr:MAG: nascent polypeptide-associated complex protein [Halobacteriales archaeon QS_4_69_34]